LAQENNSEFGNAGDVLCIDHGDSVQKWKRINERAQSQRAKERWEQPMGYSS
jgi:hypothetical protein